MHVCAVVSAGASMHHGAAASVSGLDLLHFSGLFVHRTKKVGIALSLLWRFRLCVWTVRL